MIIFGSFLDILILIFILMVLMFIIDVFYILVSIFLYFYVFLNLYNKLFEIDKWVSKILFLVRLYGGKF